MDYTGHPEAERVTRGDGLGRADGRRDRGPLSCDRGERVGVVQVRLYRPVSHQGAARRAAGDGARIGVLDRTKEPGSQR